MAGFFHRNTFFLYGSIYLTSYLAGPCIAQYHLDIAFSLMASISLSLLGIAILAISVFINKATLDNTLFYLLVAGCIQSWFVAYATRSMYRNSILDPGLLLAISLLSILIAFVSVVAAIRLLIAMHKAGK